MNFNDVLPLDLSSTCNREIIQKSFHITKNAGFFAKEMHSKNFSIHHKDSIDLVTEIDIKTEKQIISSIESSFPDHSIVSEEIGEIRKSSPFTWIIDPIDGTTNYAHRLPFWAVSIGIYENDNPIIGLVFAPEMNQFFIGIHSQGAWLNGQRIFVSTCENISQSLLSTGFPYDIRETSYTNLDLFSYFCKKTQAVRRFGSASIDICYVATGLLDGYWEQDLKHWDFAAAKIILEEANGIITTIHGDTLPWKHSSVLCANKKLHSVIATEIAHSNAILKRI
ncbi:MAG: inositol monophosphatase [Caldisericia bacterium]|nr:inositol monophosphatase [Caldisericia bacterium]